MAPDRLASPQNKTVAELGQEAVAFLLHTVVAVAFLAAVLVAMTLAHPDPDSPTPKIFGTAFAFVVPMLGGFVIAVWRRNPVGGSIWISALLTFTAASAWVLDLPTAPGMCEACDATEKLWRTFFTLSDGSGLLNGDGLLIGVWIPLAMLGYSVGAALGLGV